MAGLVLPRALTFAVATAFLTCALTLSLSLSLSVALGQYGSSNQNVDVPQDPIIHQVTDDHAHLLGTERKFKMFMEKYGKTYSSREEYVHRLRIFAKNLIRAAEHQALDPTAVHGVTPFSDLSPEEFEQSYAGLRGGPGFGNGFPELTTAPPLEVSDLPESFDWREKGAVTEVKIQVIIISFLFSCLF